MPEHTNTAIIYWAATVICMQQHVCIGARVSILLPQLSYHCYCSHTPKLVQFEEVPLRMSKLVLLLTAANVVDGILLLHHDR
jgi:hypothetical protein